jgi:hypothetical protein
MGVNHILGWYYGKLSWNRIWCHSNNLIANFAIGPRRLVLQSSARMGFRYKTFKNGKEISRTDVSSIKEGLPPIEIDKDLSM